MKIFKTLSLVAVLSFLFYGCPSDTPPTPPATTYYDYLPLTNANYWNYTNTVESTSATSADSLYIDGTTIIGSNSYFQFDANVEATGIYTLYMKNINLRKDNHNYIANGTFTINLGTEAIDIAINDEIMLSESGNAGDVLSTVSGTQTQTVSSIPLTISYSLKTEVVAVNASETIAGTVYTNTIRTKTTLNMKIDATVSGITVSAMNQQDVVTMYNTYADQKGMLLSDTDVEYHLQDFSAYGISLGIPQDYNESSQQVIVNYNIN
jgi:hypothetical protein